MLNRISLLGECKREGKLPSPLLWVSRYSFVFNFSILICYSHFCALVFKFNLSLSTLYNRQERTSTEKRKNSRARFNLKIYDYG